MNEIFKRASVRKFKPDKVTPVQIDQLVRAAMAAPTAGNQQGWEFFVVTDPELIHKLEAASPYYGALKTAPLAIVVLADLNRMRLPDYWQQDSAAATENILLEAVSLDLGAVWMAVSPNETRIKAVSELLGLPHNVKPFNVIAIGTPETPVTQLDRFDSRKIHTNTY